MKNYLNIPELIFKKISDSISADELKELNAWINLNDENKLVYEDLLDQEYIKKALNKYYAYDIQSAWINTEERLKPKKAKVVLLTNKLLRYAAILIIPLLIGAYLIYETKKAEDTKVAQNTTELPFKPGSQKAMLTLSNGIEIGVGADKGANIISISASTEIRDTNYTLVYDKTTPKPGDLKYNILKTPKGGEYRLVLADGSKVWLNAASELKYPVNFSGSERKVTIEGEAYFEIAKNKDKPFIVHTKGYDVEVLGTSFNIMAYNNEQQIATTLDEGAVKITRAGNKNSIYLSPGQQAILHENSTRIKIADVDTYQYTSWKDGLFVFKSEPLGSISRKISKWYNCEIQFEDSEIKNTKFTGTLRRDIDLDKLLDIISQTCQIDFSVNENKVIIISINN
jgi:hypothetical protein